MDSLRTFLQEFGSTLGTLAKAQSILVLLAASWVFTGVWVYATERKHHPESHSDRAWLGLFWLPGLLLYYLFPEGYVADTPSNETFTFSQTPKTVEASFAERRQEEAATFDGHTLSRGAAHSTGDNQKTSDGDVQRSSPQAPPRKESPPTRSVPGFWLEVLEGPSPGTRYPSPSGKRKVYVGSRSNNDIIVDETSVAPWHVALSYEDNHQWVLRVVEHAQAEYKTKVNELSATVKPLKPGDEIQLGDVRLRFHL
jgi:hypothetical protein